jgi:hypothetical protein
MHVHDFWTTPFCKSSRTFRTTWQQEEWDARAAQEAMWEDERAVDEQAQAELEAQGQGEAEAQAEADAGPRRACDATQSPAHIRRRHLNGEHTTWCSQRKCGVIACKYTGRLSRVGLPTAVEEAE